MSPGVWNNQMLDRSQTIDSKDGEMSEWLSAYAAKPLRRTSRRSSRWDASGGG